MSKEPTPKADGLRAMREETRGHLQATAEKPAGYVEGAKAAAAAVAIPAKPLIPYAGRERCLGDVPYSKTPRPDKPPRNRNKYKRKIT